MLETREVIPQSLAQCAYGKFAHFVSTEAEYSPEISENRAPPNQSLT